jgi:hypothetical protein
LSWNEALTFCNNLAIGSCGLNDGSAAGDWRLPNRKELFSLLDYSQYYPALPQGHLFDNVQLVGYSSASTRANNTSYAWVQALFIGHQYWSRKNTSGPVWPVRGGQGGPIIPDPDPEPQAKAMPWIPLLLFDD